MSAVAKDFAECLTRQEKRCCDCGETKPLDCFHFNAGMPDHRQYRCKTCRAKYDKARKLRHMPISKLLALWKPPVVVIEMEASGR